MTDLDLEMLDALDQLAASQLTWGPLPDLGPAGTDAPDEAGRFDDPTERLHLRVPVVVSNNGRLLERETLVDDGFTGGERRPGPAGEPSAYAGTPSGFSHGQWLDVTSQSLHFIVGGVGPIESVPARTTIALEHADGTVRLLLHSMRHQTLFLWTPFHRSLATVVNRLSSGFVAAETTRLDKEIERVRQNLDGLLARRAGFDHRLETGLESLRQLAAAQPDRSRVTATVIEAWTERFQKPLVGPVRPRHRPRADVSVHVDWERNRRREDLARRFLETLGRVGGQDWTDAITAVVGVEKSDERRWLEATIMVAAGLKQIDRVWQASEHSARLGVLTELRSLVAGDILRLQKDASPSKDEIRARFEDLAAIDEELEELRESGNV